MKKYAGTGVYGAVAAGTVWIYRRKQVEIFGERIEDAQKEWRRLEAARKKSIRQLEELMERSSGRNKAGDAGRQILEAHRMILEDEGFLEKIREMIRSQSVNAEYAVTESAKYFVELFAAMEDPRMRARAEDIKDISQRLTACLGGVENLSETGTGERIICARDLAPSETAALVTGKVLAFVTAEGSAYSHTAILARDKKIPAVVGVGGDFWNEIKDGDRMIVDGNTGEIFVNPDAKTEARMRQKKESDLRREAILRNLVGKENVTLDGTKIEIFANIKGEEGIEDALAADAGGIGLLRSEFLYLQRKDYPSEELQFGVYRRVLERMAGRKVIIRTSDIGADKEAEYFHLDKEENPALGLRAVRLCFERPEMFKTQLRALYRASAYGNLGILFPMITNVWEVKKILSVCEEVKQELKQEEVPMGNHVELGIMIETPAAAVISDRLAPLVDFFSVGTNDLTQYTLACDRQNAKVNAFWDPHHEAVLRLVEQTAENAHKNGTRIGICGELAADLSLTETFLRMGIDELSVAAPFVLPLRQAVRKLDLRGR